MHTAIASAQPPSAHSVHNFASPGAPAPGCAESAFTRATTDGAFSLFEHGSIRIGAEAGLVIRVHAGCLWVPHHEEYCSVSVGAGEQFVVNRAGEVTVLASHGTHVELEWPSREHAAADLH